MKESEVKRLFALLGELHPRERKGADSKEKVLAWSLVLAPFTYDEVKQAAIERSRVNRFYPEPAELTQGLEQPRDNTVCPIARERYLRDAARMDEILARGACREGAL